uniref:Cellular retinoic acid-binding protein 1 n=1 Tax=Sparus aurata TaxID=8175 RepID=A0A671WJ75_SPAAU
MERKIPNFAGTWDMKSSENFEELLKKLGVNKMLRMIAVTAASKPLVEISQDGETLSIKTSTTVRTTHITFTVGQEFNEATVDGRPCTSFPRWETDSKISCEQILQKGEGPKTSWTREITNDGKLILVRHTNYPSRQSLSEPTTLYCRLQSTDYRDILLYIWGISTSLNHNYLLC